MKYLTIISLTLTMLITGQVPELVAQNRLVGGPCEGCEAVFEFGDRELSHDIRIPGTRDYYPQLEISGTVYRPDGTTPAEGVILYVYQTGRSGKYTEVSGATGWGRRHGLHRGWLKTDENGRYIIRTFRPGSYGRLPAHIHTTVLEPNGRYYYIGDFLFSDDPYLARAGNRKEIRGGPGHILKLSNDDENKKFYTATRDIILGMHVEGY